LLDQPLISVLLPVHEMNEYSKPAIESIIGQDYSNFELLILDSSVNQEFKGWDKQDVRIRSIRIEPSANLSKSLNVGLKLSRGEFIARMDSDDIALPARFAIQIKHMVNHPGTQVLGGGIRFIGHESHEKGLIGKQLIIESSQDNYMTYLMYKNPLFHPTVMFRKEVFINESNFYNEKYLRAQDIELWSRLSRNYKIHNLSEVVLEYRIHSTQSGRTQPKISKFFSTTAKLKHSFWMAFNQREARSKAILNIFRILTGLPSIYLQYLIARINFPSRLKKKIAN
jgi:glycosyltransferase involved in cell wall biosynthesis